MNAELRNESNLPSYPYVTGGALGVDNPTYVCRTADDELYGFLKSGEFCYVFNTRQMGKTSLLKRVASRLKQEEITCIDIDLSSGVSGGSEASDENFYYGIIREISKQAHLSNKDYILNDWWRGVSQNLSPIQRFNAFIEDILLNQIKQKIIIFLDEIDQTFSLSFRDDFFALIRGLYNRRSNGSEYTKLVFCLLGVATPQDLIKDKSKTSYNIGKAVELTGFTFKSAEEPLLPGLKAENSSAVLQAILNWTDGQPFLTQKVCQLISDSDSIISQTREIDDVGRLVEERIIKNWEYENKGDQNHFGQIRDKLLLNRTSRDITQLLNLYKQVLGQKEIRFDDKNQAHVELKLIGLVVGQRDGTLKVFNKIYKSVFNSQWIQEQLGRLCPFEEALSAWLQDPDDTRLLPIGKPLDEAIEWLESNLDTATDNHRAFVKASKDNGSDGNGGHGESLDSLRQQLELILKDKADDLATVIQEIERWVGSSASLLESIFGKLKTLINSNSPIKHYEEADKVAKLMCDSSIKSHIHQQWAELLDWKEASDKAQATYLVKIFDYIYDEDIEDSKKILELYERILQGDEVLSESTPVQRRLRESGLIQINNKKLKVANDLYKYVFDQDWVRQEKELTKERRIVDGRYIVLNRNLIKEKQTDGNLLKVYKVRERRPSKEKFILKELDISSGDGECLNSEQESKFHAELRKLEDLKNFDSKAAQGVFARGNYDDPLLYVIQPILDFEPIGNDSNEIQPKCLWTEDDVIQFLTKILEKLNKLHLRKVYHLNLKPSNFGRSKDNNVMDSQGEFVLLDSHILKSFSVLTFNEENRTDTIASVDLPYIHLDCRDSYNSPDRYSIEDSLKIQWDLYSLGMTAIQCLTGIKPEGFNFHPEDNKKILWQFVFADRPFPTISKQLAGILNQMIEINPKERYSSANDVIEDIHKLTKHLSWQRKFDHYKAKIFNALKTPEGVVGLSTLLAVISIGGVFYWQDFIRKREDTSKLEKNISPSVQEALSRSSTSKDLANIVTLHTIDTYLNSSSHKHESPEINLLLARSYIVRGMFEQKMLEEEKAKADFINAQKELEKIVYFYKDTKEISPLLARASFYLGLLDESVYLKESFPSFYDTAIRIYADMSQHKKNEKANDISDGKDKNYSLDQLDGLIIVRLVSVGKSIQEREQISKKIEPILNNQSLLGSLKGAKDLGAIQHYLGIQKLKEAFDQLSFENTERNLENAKSLAQEAKMLLEESQSQKNTHRLILDRDRTALYFYYVLQSYLDLNKEDSLRAADEFFNLNSKNEESKLYKISRGKANRIGKCRGTSPGSEQNECVKNLVKDTRDTASVYKDLVNNLSLNFNCPNDMALAVLDPKFCGLNSALKIEDKSSE